MKSVEEDRKKNGKILLRKKVHQKYHRRRVYTRTGD